MRATQSGTHKLLSTVSIIEALADALRRQVLDGTLAPGTPVTESQVAADFNVARPTAKSAIMTLVHEGILRRAPHRSAYVPRLSAEDVKDIFLARIPIELEVIDQLIARGAVPDAALFAIERLNSTTDTTPHSEFVAADLEFHRVLVDAVASERLTRLYNVLLGEIHLCMVQTRSVLGRTTIVAQHRSIFDALRQGDHKTATTAMRSHLIGAREALCRALSAAE